MKKWNSLILLLLLSLNAISQVNGPEKESGTRNKFGIYYLSSDSVLRSFIGNYLKNVEPGATIYLSINVQIIDSRSLETFKYVMPANIPFVKRNFDLDKIPKLVKLTSHEVDEIAFYKVDPSSDCKLKNKSTDQLLKKYLYNNTNIVKKNIDPKLLLALIHKWNSEGILVFRDELSGYLELSNKTFDW